MKKKYFKLFMVVCALFMFVAPHNVFAENDREFMDTQKHVSCGNGLIKKMPSQIPDITKSIYDLAMVVTPIILVVMGTVDLVKGIMTGKEDEMKKSRETFIQRLIIGILVFLIALIARFVVSVVAGTNSNYTRIINCMDCFLQGSSKCS